MAHHLGVALGAAGDLAYKPGTLLLFLRGKESAVHRLGVGGQR